MQRHSYEVRKSLLHARRAILPMREVVTTVMRRVTDDGHNELTPYYEDLYDHILRAGEWTDSLRDLLGSIFETNLSLADQRMNTIMKKLTVVGGDHRRADRDHRLLRPEHPLPRLRPRVGLRAQHGVDRADRARALRHFRKRDWL